MRFRLFDYLNLSIPKAVSGTPEKILFDRESNILGLYEPSRRWLDPLTPFDYILACVIIKALLNKKNIESFAILYSKLKSIPKENIDSLHKDQPSLLYRGKPIYVPIFPPRLNERYGSDISSLNKEPFSSIKTVKGTEAFYTNPFFAYGAAIFDSNFTSLLKIEEKQNLSVFYSYSFDTIYIISDQGTLEFSIPLFDKNLERPDRSDLPERIKRLMVPFFAYDREGFIQNLYDLGFISSDLISSIQEKSIKEKARFGRLEDDM